MRGNQLRGPRLRKATARTALVCAAAVIAMAMSDTDAMALDSGVTAANFTSDQPDWYAGASVSAGYHARLTFQSDGNLVLYALSDTQDWPLWASGTDGKGVTHVDWSKSGYIKLLSDWFGAPDTLS